ncbi:MAG TPA: hypothetical protein VFS43_38460, partial [Polyangiaceae bacterium]|nr:hypothetical protein [Polyangiaceae bacterium]
MKTALFALAIALAAGCSSGPAPSAPGAPPRVPSAADIALQGPQKSADTLTLLSHAHDSARLGAALVAAETCPAGDRACAEARKREALEAFASAGAALEALVHVRRELFPAG